MVKARALLLAKARLVLASLLRSILATTRSQGEEERIETNNNFTFFVNFFSTARNWKNLHTESSIQM